MSLLRNYWAPLPLDKEQKQANYALAKQLYGEENFPAAAVSGAIAAIIAAFLMAITTRMWPFAHGFAMAGTGIVIGLQMQFLGRGIAAKFSVLATVYTILACLLGSLIIVLLQYQSPQLSAVGVLTSNSLSWIVRRLLDHFSFVYCFVAVVAAVFLAKRPLSRAQRLAIGLHEMRDDAAS